MHRFGFVRRRDFRKSKAARSAALQIPNAPLRRAFYLDHRLGRAPMLVLVVLGIIGISAVALVLYFTTRHPETPAPHPLAVTKLAPAPEASAPASPSTVDPAEVFRRAFWKRPSPDDVILHANQREWTDAEGRVTWQWAIAVRPGPALAAYLADNPFALVPAESVILADSPDWFPQSAAGLDVQRSPASRLVHLRDPITGVLYATDRGGGLHGAVVD